jgi:hypothetical protein
MRRRALRRIINVLEPGSYCTWRGGGDGGNDMILDLNAWKLRESVPSVASVVGGSVLICA